MIRIIPYLLVKNAKKAIEYYVKVFDAKLINHQSFNEEIIKSMKLNYNEDLSESTMHATISIRGSSIYLADNTQETQDNGHVEITLEIETRQEIQAFFDNAKKHGCQIKMELNHYDWGWYARIIDPFGVGWQFNCAC